MKKESINSNFVVIADTPIEEVMKIITLNKRGAVVVVDDKGKVLGIASDGDIRRALVHGVNVFAPINKTMNPTFQFIRKDSAEDKKPDSFFKTHPNLTIVPVVDHNFILSHVYKIVGV